LNSEGNFQTETRTFNLVSSPRKKGGERVERGLLPRAKGRRGDGAPSVKEKGLRKGEKEREVWRRLRYTAFEESAFIARSFLLRV